MKDYIAVDWGSTQLRGTASASKRSSCRWVLPA